MWIRKIFAEREEKSEYYLLVKDMHLFDHEYFFKCFRMSPTTFELLLSSVAPLIVRSSRSRSVASPAERLCVTLRHLSTGDAHVTIAASYRISPSVVGRIIKETCAVIWKVAQYYLQPPQDHKAWHKIASEFENKWNFPHCLGAIDGKHVVIQAPPRSGSDYFNYKKTHSIVLLAVCDANYNFTLVDIGDNGRQSDGGVYMNSKLGYAIDNNLLDLPATDFITNTVNNIKYPYVFVADDAFSMKTYMIKPYPKSCLNDPTKVITNYRISRARRVIENSFGILASRFRVFRRPIIASVETVCNIVKATLALHNFLMKITQTDDRYQYCPRNYIDSDSGNSIRPGRWRNEIGDVTGLNGFHGNDRGSNNCSALAKKVRDDFNNYFNSPEGAVSWQTEITTSTRNSFDKY